MAYTPEDTQSMIDTNSFSSDEKYTAQLRFIYSNKRKILIKIKYEKISLITHNNLSRLQIKYSNLKKC